MMMLPAFLTLGLFSRVILGAATDEPSSTITTCIPSSTTGTASTPSPTQPGAISTCDLWYYVVNGDTCDSIVAKYAYENLTTAEFYEYNPGVGSSCTSLWLNYYVCVGVSSYSGAPSSTSQTTAAAATTSTAA